jgi:hypothetical protein
MAISTSELRSNIYRILDEILTRGASLEVERNGQILVILPKQYLDKTLKDRNKQKFNWISRNCVLGDSEDLDKISWDQAWNGANELFIAEQNHKYGSASINKTKSKVKNRKNTK